MAHTAEHEEAVNADSFLDIVASVVSVMIIMVMTTGLKIKNTPLEALPTSELARAGGDLLQKQHEETALRGDVERISTEMEEVLAQAAKRERERDVLALAVTGLDQQVRGARPSTTQQPPADGRLTAKVIDARNRLEILNRQREAIDKSPAQSVQIESFTTPLGRTVDGREVHFQLNHGRIAYVPLNELIEKALVDFRRKAHKLSERAELTDTVPPEQGFRLTYFIKLRPPTTEEIQESGSQRPRIEDRVVLSPVADNLGETVDEAFRPGSQFQQALADRRAKDATITLWTYPDSFDDFRRVKKELYRRGFPVAARPLPEGVPISGSSSGSKSTAE
ncbi:MAG: hypothetical protein ABSG53_06165 [Thermoguttaceae bacterium]|jgi:hypothetical protein